MPITLPVPYTVKDIAASGQPKIQTHQPAALDGEYDGDAAVHGEGGRSVILSQPEVTSEREKGGCEGRVSQVLPLLLPSESYTMLRSAFLPSPLPSPMLPSSLLSAPLTLVPIKSRAQR